ncbi:hypothetical protein CAAN1_02S05248 [[Candida] anglica]|uniref:Rho-GAP domain-containing protein n=1 Tax=[Candida] anglica TaxID=148631 RepID=A0ABP0ECT2_9ASCO
MSFSVSIEDKDVNVSRSIHTCFLYILNHGNVTGIFRVSGSAVRIRFLTEHLTNNPETDLETFQKSYMFTVHDITAVLKKLLATSLRHSDFTIVNNRQLLENLQTIYVLEQDSKCVVRKSCDIIDLPRINMHLLVYVSYQLHRIAAMEETTSMSASNLSIIFQPYLFNNLVITNPDDLKCLRGVIEAFIVHSPLVVELLQEKEKFLTPMTSTSTPASIQVKRMAVEEEKKPFILRRALSLRVKRLKS